MSALLKQWVNETVGVTGTVNSIERDFANGYNFGEVLALHGRQPDFDKFDARPATDAAKLANFQRIREPLRALGVGLSKRLVRDILEEQRGASAELLFSIRAALKRAGRPSPPPKPTAWHTRRPKARREEPKDETWMQRTIRNVGTDNFNNLDMAIHLRKFQDERERQELSAAEEAASVHAMQAKEKAERRLDKLARANTRTAFINEWIDHGVADWRQNQRDLRRREQQELQHELSVVQKAVQQDRNLRAAKRAEAKGGIAAFETGLKRLGLGADVSTGNAARAEPLQPARGSGAAHLAKLEQLVATEGYVPSANRRDMQDLHEKRFAQIQAQKERERRRRMNALEQVQTQEKAHRDAEIASLLKYLREAGATRRTRAHAAWHSRRARVAQAHASAAQAAATRVAQSEGFNAYASQFADAAAERWAAKAPARAKETERREKEARSKAKLRHARAIEMCAEVAWKLCDLALAVVDRRERARRADPDENSVHYDAEGRIPPAEYRALKARFVSRHPIELSVGDDDQEVEAVSGADDATAAITESAILREINGVLFDEHRPNADEIRFNDVVAATAELAKLPPPPRMPPKVDSFTVVLTGFQPPDVVTTTGAEAELVSEQVEVEDNTESACAQLDRAAREFYGIDTSSGTGGVASRIGAKLAERWGLRSISAASAIRTALDCSQGGLSSNDAEAASTATSTDDLSERECARRLRWSGLALAAAMKARDDIDDFASFMQTACDDELVAKAPAALVARAVARVLLWSRAGGTSGGDGGDYRGAALLNYPSSVVEAVALSSQMCPSADQIEAETEAEAADAAMAAYEAELRAAEDNPKAKKSKAPKPAVWPGVETDGGAKKGKGKAKGKGKGKNDDAGDGATVELVQPADFVVVCGAPDWSLGESAVATAAEKAQATEGDTEEVQPLSLHAALMQWWRQFGDSTWIECPLEGLHVKSNSDRVTDAQNPDDEVAEDDASVDGDEDQESNDDDIEEKQNETQNEENNMEDVDDENKASEDHVGVQGATEELNFELLDGKTSRSPEQRLALAFETLDLVLESMLIGNPAVKQAAAQAELEAVVETEARERQARLDAASRQEAAHDADDVADGDIVVNSEDGTESTEGEQPPPAPIAPSVLPDMIEAARTERRAALRLAERLRLELCVGERTLPDNDDTIFAAVQPSALRSEDDGGENDDVTESKAAVEELDVFMVRALPVQKAWTEAVAQYEKALAAATTVLRRRAAAATADIAQRVGAVGAALEQAHGSERAAQRSLLRQLATAQAEADDAYALAHPGPPRGQRTMQNMKPSPEEVVARRKKDSLWQELADAALCDFELALGDDAEKAAERAAAGIIDQGLSAAENVSQAEAKHATEAKEDDLDRPPIVNEWTKKLLDALGAIGLTETPRVFAARELATVYHKTIEGTGARGNELEKTLAAVDANAAARDARLARAAATARAALSSEVANACAALEQDIGDFVALRAAMTRRCVAAARKALAAGANAAGISAAVRSAVEEASAQPTMNTGSPASKRAGGVTTDNGDDDDDGVVALASMPSFRDEGQLGIIDEDEGNADGD